jgi:anti-anti-sigma regulatory factor
MLRPRGALALESDGLMRGVFHRAGRWGAVIIDLTDVTTITASSARQLVDRTESASAKRRSVILRGGSPHVQDMLLRASREGGL